ncbi:type IV pilin protein [Snodgrassella sp. ESL0253]|uniref:type IV pilin protein n=1 Tax=Snodgrassella sp. ESL0253 TaxID=2705031 RepID=UPI001582BE84|nr:type IV pilin protein [Snodgrassella sp. ESL0253]NUE66680.1 prepilin-type N-terminal cleavage/methylation domain-containing protein [Snodgrassella sp. ESL0253]
MQRHNQGFTLIDLMITVTIIAILAVIAYPSYNNYVIKAREQNARADIVRNVNKLERYYAKNKTFSGYADNLLEQTQSAKYFTLAGNYQPSTYRLVATPTAANSGATRVVIYDSLKGMLLCENAQQQDCNPY